MLIIFYIEIQILNRKVIFLLSLLFKIFSSIIVKVFFNINEVNCLLKLFDIENHNSI